MRCPKCDGVQLCSCNACGNTAKGLVTWHWVNGDWCACGHCGFTLHCDQWLDIEYSWITGEYESVRALCRGLYFGGNGEP